jgi:hypothetical protein
VIALAAIILAVILVITGLHQQVKKNRWQTGLRCTKLRAELCERKYYQAFEYSIIGKDGLITTSRKNYLSIMTQKRTKRKRAL